MSFPRALLLAPLALLLVSLTGATSHAQDALSEFLYGNGAASDEVRVWLEGDDPSLELRTYEGMYFAGTAAVLVPNGQGGYTTSSQSIQRRAYDRVGFVGQSVMLRRGSYAFTVFPQVVPSHLHEPAPYRVEITDDVVGLRLAYTDRRPARVRRWVITMGMVVVGSALCGLATIDGLATNPERDLNRPLIIAGSVLATGGMLTIVIPLVTRDRARIDVVHADGRVVRATHRVRN